MLFNMVVKNLIENAVKYSDDGADIKVITKNGILKVFNSKANVKEEHLPCLGQRFYRPSGQNEKGSGLGLSIVMLIAKYYKCDVCFANINNGFEVTISGK